MLHTALTTTAVYAAGFSISGETIGDWIKGNVLYVLIVIAVLAIIVAAFTKKPRDAAVTFGIVLLGLALLGIATNMDDVTSWFSSTFFGS